MTVFVVRDNLFIPGVISASWAFTPAWHGLGTAASGRPTGETGCLLKAENVQERGGYHG